MTTNGKTIEFAAQGRKVSGYLATPPGSGAQGPGVVLLQEWWGLVDHIKDVADRLANAGFVTLAPDLYHGDTTTSPDDAGRKMMALDIAKAGTELGGAIDYLLAFSGTQPRKVAAMGFCMGGQLALFAATQHPDKVAAVVDFYGIHPNVEIAAERLSAPVLAHFGLNDEFVASDSARALVQRIEAAGKPIEAHFYAAGHAFFNDSRPEAYRRESAELAWERTLAFLRAKLA